MRTIWLEWNKKGKDYIVRKNYETQEEMEDEREYYSKQFRRLYKENKIWWYMISAS